MKKISFLLVSFLALSLVFGWQANFAQADFMCKCTTGSTQFVTQDQQACELQCPQGGGTVDMGKSYEISEGPGGMNPNADPGSDASTYSDNPLGVGYQENVSDVTNKSSIPQSKTSLPNPLGVRSFSELITKIANFVLTLAIPFAVLMLILVGFQYVTAQGEPAKISKANNNLKWTIAGIALIVVSKVLISYIQDLLTGGGGLANSFISKIKNTLNTAVIPILFTLTTLYFVWGVIQYVLGAQGDESKLKRGKQQMLWGIIGMAIMASAWGIVGIIQNFLR